MICSPVQSQSQKTRASKSTCPPPIQSLKWTASKSMSLMSHPLRTRGSLWRSPMLHPDRTFDRFWDLCDAQMIVRSTRSLQRDPNTLYYLVRLRGHRSPLMVPAEEAKEKIPLIVAFYEEQISLGVHFCYSNLAIILADNQLRLTINCDCQSTATDNWLWPTINCVRQLTAADMYLYPVYPRYSWYSIIAKILVYLSP